MHKKQIIIFITFVVLFLLGMGIRSEIIDENLPYLKHPDESTISRASCNILATGSFDPNFYYYPPLSFYVAAAGNAVFFLKSASELKIKNTQHIGRCNIPYYDSPFVIEGAKILFASLSILSLIFYGILAFQYFGTSQAVSTVGIGLMSSFYTYYSAYYLNVDIVGAFFAATFLFFLLNKHNRLRHDHPIAFVLALSLITACAFATKYNLFALALIGLAYIFISFPLARWRTLFVYILGCVGFFILVNPFFFIDFNMAISGMAREIFHYKQGHIGSNDMHQPGLQTVYLYLGYLLEDFSIASLIPVTIGGFLIIFKAPKLIWLIVYSAFLVLYMSTQQATNIRNIISAFPIYAMLLSIGLCWLAAIAQGFIAKKLKFGNRNTAINTSIYGAVLLIAVGIIIPLERSAAWIGFEGDNRVQATKWAKRNLPESSTVFYSSHLSLSPRLIEGPIKFMGVKSPEEAQNIAHENGISNAYYLSKKIKDASKNSQLNKTFKEFSLEPKYINSPIHLSSLAE